MANRASQKPIRATWSTGSEVFGFDPDGTNVNFTDEALREAVNGELVTIGSSNGGRLSFPAPVDGVITPDNLGMFGLTEVIDEHIYANTLDIASSAVYGDLLPANMTIPADAGAGDMFIIEAFGLYKNNNGGGTPSDFSMKLLYDPAGANATRLEMQRSGIVAEAGQKPVWFRAYAGFDWSSGIFGGTLGQMIIGATSGVDGATDMRHDSGGGVAAGDDFMLQAKHSVSDAATTFKPVRISMSRVHSLS